ncbi:acyltransferase family protein [Aquabacterium sp.]|uniref:acyltransferase family protein n=1 Tax=Aquabacterium sp. TaxID=1872578 RepID=UPI002E342196|nr:acyltransferase family protein [Aquabacterium sp.]HEX5311190.1 acyltransferase family protein [Aquabacterium sp.]
MSIHIAHYRPDIDGLRAIAVGAVLLFHAFPDALPGGFVGVDIFFVISGYLISSILIKETQQGRFSIVQFYIRRARRLFPALLTVLLATLIAGWLIMFPGEWRALGKHTAAGAAFVSNLALWQESGYFDSSSDLKPLLHLWSLAVEEQFYLLWPMLVFLVGRRSIQALGWSTIALLALSLAVSSWLTTHNATAAFYAPVTRFWELLTGSALAIMQMRKPAMWTALRAPSRHVMSLAGIAALIGSIALFSSGMGFPGYIAAIPVVGSALLIAAGKDAVINKWVLSQRWIVGIGLISYPLYLWHWPILVMNRLWSDGKPESPATLATLLLAAMLLAWLTYRYVESPLRDSTRATRAAKDARNLWLALLAFGALGLGAWKGHLPSHSQQAAVVQKIDSAESDWESIGDQTWPGGKAGTVLFVGDSHMQHYAPRISEIMKTRRSEAHTVRLMALSGCAPVPGINRLSLDCAHFADEAFEAMQAPEVVTVVLAASWKGFSVRPDYYRVDDPTHRTIAPLTDDSQWVLDAWRDRLRSLVLAGKHVVVVLSSPRGPLVEPKHLIDRHLWFWDSSASGVRNYSELKQVVKDVDARIAKAAQEAGAEIVDPFQDFCHEGACSVTTVDGAPIFMDDSHIRASFAHHHIHVLDPYFFLY